MINLDLIHRIELEILAKVDQVNSRNHLTYVLTGGSAIGAARHHGFIPWDDDIDIGLTRTDFEKFLRVAPHELNHSGYFVEENRLDPKYEYDFAKVMAAGTHIIEHGRESTKARNGIFIDVFPFDRMPKQVSEQQQQKAALADILTEIRQRLYPNAERQQLIQSKYADMSLNELYETRLSVMTKYDGHHNLPLINMSSPYEYGHELIEPWEFHHIIRMRFENLLVPILADYHGYLTRLYGNYMKLPPLEKRIQRHVLEVKVDNYQPGSQNELRNNLEQAAS
ncbi:LicD family protein [Lentilactobacillus sunkii]|jgi:lipopolysaccharide cholinephosphotransferase|uniref:LicD family protein n=1 Tax=Lentilactobacillus sunkii TaxID=481719 RepID=A0A1E7XAH4_9LACO|nr:LicD family protein [Lentilactobacillus sunkii]OFA10126.1 LicD family protein [Lentilactobacillus sunkii]